MANMNTNTDLPKSKKINGRFINPWPTWKTPTFYNLIKFLVEPNNSSIPSKEEELDEKLPIYKPEFKFDENKISVTWIGHSTTLINFDNITILTDPIFSLRASITQLVGPARYRRAAVNVSELPPIDAVVISHNHYDHLDHNSVKALNARFGDKIHWFVPLGLAKWMHSVGCKNVTELDWWQQSSIPEKSEIKFVLTPAQHWSRRGINDDFKTLWGSWTVIGPKHRFFFTGDTGYCDVFKQIGQVFGPFDISAIPIGAYEPRWFMGPQHVDPEQAVQIHKDIKSKFSVAIHWGTFALAHEYYLEPPQKLRTALRNHNLLENEFIALSHGKTVNI
jgi:N-acyl-phosphatidylethanolamine-hydrolysing phospholipase D